MSKRCGGMEISNKERCSVTDSRKLATKIAEALVERHWYELWFISQRQADKKLFHSTNAWHTIVAEIESKLDEEGRGK